MIDEGMERRRCLRHQLRHGGEIPAAERGCDECFDARWRVS